MGGIGGQSIQNPKGEKTEREEEPTVVVPTPSTESTGDHTTITKKIKKKYYTHASPSTPTHIHCFSTTSNKTYGILPPPPPPPPPLPPPPPPPPLPFSNILINYIYT